MILMSAENFFKKKPGAEPIGRIVKPYQAVHIERGFAVIPWAGLVFSKE